MTKFPVPGLTKSQREVFEDIGSGGFGNLASARPKAIKRLLEVGAIVEAGKTLVHQDRFGEVYRTDYAVPIPLHMEWCRWCSDNYDEEGNPK